MTPDDAIRWVKNEEQLSDCGLLLTILISAIIGALGGFVIVQGL